MNTAMHCPPHEEAISPVIGAILLVALTVILAGIVAVFAFGMVQDMDAGLSIAMQPVSVTAAQEGTDITITYMGGPGYEHVTQIMARIYKPGAATPNFTITINNPEVGVSQTTSGVVFLPGDRNRVVVTARLDDGTEQVVLDTFV